MVRKDIAKCGHEVFSGKRESFQDEPRKKCWASATKIGIALFAGIAVSAIILEIALRTILGLGSPVLFEVDPTFGAYPKANQHLHRFFVDFETNQYGMRSSPVAMQKASREYKILFIGDSVPFGTTYVTQQDILVEQIGSLLHEKQYPTVVLNASSPGWAPGNELGFITSRGLYGADMVVMVYNTMDLTQSFSAYHDSPLTPLSNPPSAVGELWLRYLKPRLFSATALVDPGSTAVHGRPSEADEVNVLDTIEKTRQFVASKGARFVILFSPAFIDEVRRYQFDWDQALEKLKKWGAERDISILDMTESAKSKNVQQLYFDGIHLRPAGDKLYADAFVKWFIANQPPEFSALIRN